MFRHQKHIFAMKNGDFEYVATPLGPLLRHQKHMFAMKNDEFLHARGARA